MHPIVRDFVADVIAVTTLAEPIVEFGSLQVEGEQDADLRPLFPGSTFIGTDMRPGPGVDRTEDLRALTFSDDSIGTAICVETLEHCEDPVTACRELTRVVAPGGILIASAPMLLGIHAYPSDYFRFTPAAFSSMLAGFAAVSVAGFGDPTHPQWVFAVAAHRPALDFSVEQLPGIAAAQRRYDEAPGMFRIGPLQTDPRSLAKLVVQQLPRVARDRARRSTKPSR
jgi:SAM-dependent methyltransferase